jgi:hypothetical protein
MIEKRRTLLNSEHVIDWTATKAALYANKNSTPQQAKTAKLQSFISCEPSMLVAI